MAIQRPLKEGNVRTYQEKVGLGFTDILASEVDADVDTIYAAWNGTLGGDLTGTLPNPTVTAAAKSKWSVSGAALTPTDATKRVAIPGDTADATALVLGPRPAKFRIGAHPTADAAYLFHNRGFNSGPDNTSLPTWHLAIPNITDAFTIERAAAGAGLTTTQLLQLNNVGTLSTLGPYLHVSSRCSLHSDGAATNVWGNTSSAPGYNAGYQTWALSLYYQGDQFNVLRAGAVKLGVNSAGDLTISGNNATKATGTSWINPSDIRLKKDVTPYVHGLADILQLEPISYTLVQGEHKTCGLDAAKVQAVFPECVGTTRMKLAPEDAEETEVLTLDIHPILIALINAVKELAGRVSPVPQPT
jgi:Chaperone of endosialidase